VLYDLLDLLGLLDLFHKVCHKVYHKVYHEIVYKVVQKKAVQKEAVQKEVVQTKVQKFVHAHAQAHVQVRDPVPEVEAAVALPNEKDLVLLKKQLVLLFPFLFFVV
jgi:hypothetical protein